MVGEVRDVCHKMLSYSLNTLCCLVRHNAEWDLLLIVVLQLAAVTEVSTYSAFILHTQSTAEMFQPIM